MKRPPHLVRDESGYPSLLDLIRRSGRQAVLVGGTVAALSGVAGCGDTVDPGRDLMVQPEGLPPFDQGWDEGTNPDGDVRLAGDDPGPIPDAGDLVTGLDTGIFADPGDPGLISPDAEEVAGDEVAGTDEAMPDAAPDADSPDTDAPDDEPAA